MSSLSRLVAFISAITVTISQTQTDVVANCPTIPGLQRHVSTSTLAPPMDPTCIAINITVNVENILADPSYIIPQENFEIIQDAVLQSLNYYGVSSPIISSLPSILPTTWTVNDECPLSVDNTANKFNFIPVSHQITVDTNSMNIAYGPNNIEAQIQWQFTTPDTIVYDFNAKSVSSLIALNCGVYSTKAYIVDSQSYIVAESDIFSITNNMNQLHQDMNFINVYDKLEPNSIYSLYISVFSLSQCVNNYLEIYEQGMPISAHPVISVLADPSSCRLAHALRDTSSSPTTGFTFAIDALCKDTLPVETRKLFETILYQQHSSKTEMSQSRFNGLPVQRRRALDTLKELNEGREIRKTSKKERREFFRERSRKKGEGQLRARPARGRRRLGSRGGGRGGGKSYHFIFDNGVDNLVAPETQFKYNQQCITMNPDTLKLFSVGGQNKANGLALNSVNVYAFLGQSNLALSEQFQLNQPRAFGMCQYYKNVFDGNKEYIMIINGVKDIRDLTNPDLWYNDIIFIPLDYGERLSNNLPKIKLKHAVIDPTLYVTDSNELYIFGGRDGVNAKNYIQYIDLNVVFASSSTDTLTTMDRFEPMRLNRISPLVDTRTLKAGDIYDKCMIIFGGQDFVNDEFIDTEIPPNGLQMYCNQLDPTTAASTVADAEFTSFDISNLQKVDNFLPASSNVRTISINKYNFVNDNILYQFTTSSKACFESETQIKSAETLFKDTMFQNTLWNNMISQSQNRFKGWNNGFGAIYGIDIVLAKPSETIIDTVHVNTLCPGLSEVSCHSKVDSLGNQLCGYNVNDNVCFGVVPLTGEQGTGTYDDGYYQGEQEANNSKHYLYKIIGALTASLCVICVGIMIFLKCCKKKTGNDDDENNKQGIEFNVKKAMSPKNRNREPVHDEDSIHGLQSREIIDNSDADIIEE